MTIGAEGSISIGLAEDHTLVRDGLTALLAKLDRLEVKISVPHGQGLLAYLQTAPLSVVLLDIEMPVMNGLETCRLIHQQYGDTGIIMLSMRHDAQVIKTCITYGARGFLFKNAPLEELHHAILDVAAGRTYYSNEVIQILFSKHTSNTKSALLSGREIEIIQCLADGYSSQEIGKKLFISARTVDTHRNNVLQKLDLPNVAALVKFAVQEKLVT